MKQLLRQIHPLAWTIILGTMFGRLVTSMSIPFLSIYLTRVLEASPTETGLTVAVSSLAGVLISFYGGYISDRIGRPMVMLFSVFSWAGVFFIFSSAQHLWVFFTANTLNGLCRAFFEPTSRALLSDITPSQHKLLVFNLRYAAINLGVVFGPIIGLYLGSAESTFPFIIAGMVYVMYGLVLLFQFRVRHTHLPRPVHALAPSLRAALSTTTRDRVFLMVLIGTTFCELGYGHFGSTLAQYLTLNPNIENGSQIFSYMFSLNAMTVLLVQYPIVRKARLYSPIASLILGNILIAGSLLLFGWADGLVLLFISVILFTMMDLFIDRIAKPENKGIYFGTIGFNHLGSVIAPVFGGLLLGHFGAANGSFVFVPLALATALGLPFLWKARQLQISRERQEKVFQASA
ncbi:MDR family MFS transporter [Paenibacillus xylanilyticus]|uniref:MDR family MFS transporter n=1 Tax=Paenibacillus xylanilyticus TaxID=248903 RepID=UPI003AB0AD0E